MENLTSGGDHIIGISVIFKGIRCYNQLIAAPCLKILAELRVESTVLIKHERDRKRPEDLR